MKLLGFAAVVDDGLSCYRAPTRPERSPMSPRQGSRRASKRRSLVTAPDLTVTGSHRDKAGQVEVHDKETDVIYMIEGEATFVTGGTVVGLKSTRPGQSVGTDVKGRGDSPPDEGRCHRRAGGRSPLVQRSAQLRQLLRGQSAETLIFRLRKSRLPRSAAIGICVACAHFLRSP